MRTPRLLALAAALLATPLLAAADTSPGSGWSLTLGAWGGASRYDVLGLKHGVESLDPDTLDGNLDTYGASALLRLGVLDVGALYEGSFREAADSFVLTPLVGVKWDVTDLVRVDLLGELGGHRIANLGCGRGVGVAAVRRLQTHAVAASPARPHAARPLGRAVRALGPREEGGGGALLGRNRDPLDVRRRRVHVRRRRRRRPGD